MTSYHILTATQLIKLRKKAIRAGVWFNSLLRIDRVLIDLAIKVAIFIRSSLLSARIIAVICKVNGLLESPFVRLTQTIGCCLAKQVSAIAQRWGNNSAKCWEADKSFAIYLTMLHAKSPVC